SDQRQAQRKKASMRLAFPRKYFSRNRSRSEKHPRPRTFCDSAEQCGRRSRRARTLAEAEEGAARGPRGNAQSFSEVQAAECPALQAGVQGLGAADRAWPSPAEDVGSSRGTSRASRRGRGRNKNGGRA